MLRKPFTVALFAAALAASSLPAAAADYFAGKTVITYDGIHGMGKVQKATVTLSKGRVPIKLEYFQNVFGYGLYAAWSGPGFAKRNLSAPSDAGNVADITEQLHLDGARVL